MRLSQEAHTLLQRLTIAGWQVEIRSDMHKDGTLTPITINLAWYNSERVDDNSTMLVTLVLKMFADGDHYISMLDSDAANCFPDNFPLLFDDMVPFDEKDPENPWLSAGTEKILEEILRRTEKLQKMTAAYNEKWADR